jgi:cell wall-associated NlpC family hydrolase
VESPRRTPSSRRWSRRVAHRWIGRGRRVASSSSVALVALVTLALWAAPAAAQPPGNAEDAKEQLERVQHEAEALTEQWHAAKDVLADRRAEVTTLEAAVAPAHAALDAARGEEEQFRKQVDEVALSTFESGNLDQFNALLAAGSPQEFLDQMSALETIAADYRAALDQLIARVDETARAQAEADAAVQRARAAADEAAKAEQDLANRKRDAEIRIDEAERLLDRLSPRERRERQGPSVEAPAGPITGTGAGVEALRAAQTQLGKSYRWGAEGPGSYDCSGLTFWAFKQAGITLPRSSSQQARIGTPVSWNNLRAGDLVFYYQPVSHVGIYVGDGIMINAPQTGDVVKYQKVNSSAFSGARRL